MVRKALPRGSQTCRARTIVPWRGPGEAAGRGLGAGWALSVSLCARVCAERTKMPRAEDPGFLRVLRPGGLPGAGAVGGGPAWGGGLSDRERLGAGESGSPSEPSRPGVLLEVVVCDSTCRINKSGLCCGVFCGKLIWDCGRWRWGGGGTLAARLMPGCEDVGGDAGGAEGWGASQCWEPRLASSRWMWPLSCPCRPWDPGSLTSRLAHRSDEGERGCWGRSAALVATFWLSPDLSSLLPPPSSQLTCNS